MSDLVDGTRLASVCTNLRRTTRHSTFTTHSLSTQNVGCRKNTTIRLRLSTMTDATCISHSHMVDVIASAAILLSLRCV